MLAWMNLDYAMGLGPHKDGMGAKIGDGWVVIWFRSGNIQVMNIGLFS